MHFLLVLKLIHLLKLQQHLKQMQSLIAS